MHSLTPQRLHDTLAAVCPIVGVSIQSPGTATYSPDAAATGAQIAAANAALATFDWSDAATEAWFVQQQQAAINAGTATILDNPTLNAILETCVDRLNALASMLPNPPPPQTYAQARAAIAAKLAGS